MSNNKISSDSLQEQLDRLRDASRRKARRRKSNADRVVFASLIMFLLLSLLAARATWEAAQAPVYVVVLIALLAAALQRLLGLRVRHGKLHSGSGPQAWWWLAALLCGAVVLVAG